MTLAAYAKAVAQLQVAAGGTYSGPAIGVAQLQQALDKTRGLDPAAFLERARGVTGNFNPKLLQRGFPIVPVLQFVAGGILSYLIDRGLHAFFDSEDSAVRCELDAQGLVEALSEIDCSTNNGIAELLASLAAVIDQGTCLLAAVEDPQQRQLITGQLAALIDEAGASVAALIQERDCNLEACLADCVQRGEQELAAQPIKPVETPAVASGETPVPAASQPAQATPVAPVEPVAPASASTNAAQPVASAAVQAQTQAQVQAQVQAPTQFAAQPAAPQVAAPVQQHPQYSGWSMPAGAFSQVAAQAVPVQPATVTPMTAGITTPSSGLGSLGWELAAGVEAELRARAQAGLQVAGEWMAQAATEFIDAGLADAAPACGCDADMPANEPPAQECPPEEPAPEQPEPEQPEPECPPKESEKSVADLPPDQVPEPPAEQIKPGYAAHSGEAVEPPPEQIKGPGYQASAGTEGCSDAAAPVCTPENAAPEPVAAETAPAAPADAEVAFQAEAHVAVDAAAEIGIRKAGSWT